jgi:dienelactone hydrolase
MKKTILTIALFLCCISAIAQAPIKLYPGKAPGSESWTQQEATIEYMSPFWNEINTVILNVVDPVIIPYLPAPGTGNRAAMLVCPGGGFSALSWNNEGPQVAEWLAAHGIAAFVLKYRTSFAGSTPEEVNMVAQYTYGGKKPDDAYKALALKNRAVNDQLGDVRQLAYNDAMTAMKYIRKNASQFGVDQDKIGIVGFSAGGALALEVLYNHDEESKPNLVGSIYGAMEKPEFPADPCPLFLTATQYEIQGLSYELYGLWCKNHLPAEIHSFTDSRHGFGYRPNGASENLWAQLFYNFMRKVHFIE